MKAIYLKWHDQELKWLHKKLIPKTSGRRMEAPSKPQKPSKKVIPEVLGQLVSRDKDENGLDRRISDPGPPMRERQRDPKSSQNLLKTKNRHGKDFWIGSRSNFYRFLARQRLSKAVAKRCKIQFWSDARGDNEIWYFSSKQWLHHAPSIIVKSSFFILFYSSFEAWAFCDHGTTLKKELI